MAKRKTNVQIVKSIMEHSNYGSLVQPFIIQAITTYSTAIAQRELSELKAELGGFINEEAWQGIAKEVLEKLDHYYTS